jgi:hypothetical protein
VVDLARSKGTMCNWKRNQGNSELHVCVRRCCSLRCICTMNRCAWNDDNDAKSRLALALASRKGLSITPSKLAIGNGRGALSHAEVMGYELKCGKLDLRWCRYHGLVKANNCHSNSPFVVRVD